MDNCLVIDGLRYTFKITKVYKAISGVDYIVGVCAPTYEIVLSKNNTVFSGRTVNECLCNAAEHIRKYNHYKDTRYE